jgi:outer membrane protein
MIVTRFSLIILVLTIASKSQGQSPPAQPSLTELKLSDAVDAALRNYPSIRVSQEQVNASAAAIRLAQTAYLPRVDGLAQFNRATRNNVFGLLLPQSTIPNISGPVLGTNNLGSVWGSAEGVLVSWEPFDFGLRHASTETARVAKVHAEAGVTRSRFEISVATADAFLTLIAAQKTEVAAKAGVESWEVLQKSIHALVASQLRPGADESRINAELAAARTQLAQAQQAVAMAVATLNQFTGIDSPASSLDPGKMSEVLPPIEKPLDKPDFAKAPAAIEQHLATEQAEAHLKELGRTYVPRFSLQGAAYARGTGADPNGQRLGGANGLAPTFQNYGLGFSVTFPLAELPAIRAQQAEQTANVRASEAEYQQIKITLKAKWEEAQAALNGAKQIAANTPVELEAARTALAQANARYKAGLTTVDDVAQAQRLSVRAEIDDSLARLNVWRGLLQLRTAEGSIESFIAATRQ